MAAHATHALPHALAEWARFGVSTGMSARAQKLVPLDWPELARVLPDGGLPHGVIELASPHAKHGPGVQTMRGGATTIALASVRAVHARDGRAWCAWITPTTTPVLHAPAVAQAGVDLDRLLVVRPEPAALARTAVKVAASGAFDLVIVDALVGLDGRLDASDPSASSAASASSARRARVDGSVVVRKLALSAEERGTASLLLTNLYAPRPLAWPVALRLEVERRPEAIAVRVTKDRRGRASSQHVVRLAG